MSNHSTTPTRFRQLRWKLTLSYTAVTLGALLTMEFVLLGVVGFGLIGLINSGFLPAQLIEAASADYVPVLRYYLSQTPPDQEGIAIWLERVGAASSVTIPLSFEATDEMLVVGIDGKLLGVKPLDLLGSVSIGEPLDSKAITGIAGPLEAALSGIDDAERLYTLVESEGKVIIALPIWDEAHQQVLGALVGVGELPTVLTQLGDVLPILGVSLLFFTLIAGVIGTAYGFLAAREPVHRLNHLSDASLAWSHGDFTVFVNDASGDELGQLADRLNGMAQQLQHLIDTRRELAVVEERNRLARDLHDSAKQQAFAAAAQISAVKMLLKQDPEAAEAHIEEAERLIYDLRQELTNLIQELRPAALGDKGLAAAVRENSADWSRQNGIELEVRVQRDQSLPLDIELTVFRIVQEALANIARHSQASSVEIALVYTKIELACTISDNGEGFDPVKKQGGFGLRSMHERASAHGGTLVVESAAGTGTRISFTVPLTEIRSREENNHDE